MKLVTSAEMRTLEKRAAAAGVSSATLMEAAGLAAAQEVWMLFGVMAERRVVVLVGPGNNGGDGLVAARHLHEWGAEVRCYALTRRDDAQWRETAAAGIPCSCAEDDTDFEALEELLAGADGVLDALLGTGHARPITGTLAAILERLAAVRARPRPPRLLAVDLPSGVDADGGAADPLSVAADLTITFHAPKVGLYMQPGAALAGRVETVAIGIPDELDADLQRELLDRKLAKGLLPARPADANKGTFGRVLVLAGSAPYPGAAVLACTAAYRAGAGLVTLATPRSLIAGMVTAMPEVTYLPLPEDTEAGTVDEGVLPLLQQALPQYQSLVIGCGLGTAAGTQAAVRQLLQDKALAQLRAIVIDADGLNALAGTDWAADLPAPTVVTPHPGEMARLIDADVATVQAARLVTAQDRAAAWGCTVTLKGANSVIAAADGRARLSPVATAALASAGTGDVLAGTIGALAAQGVDPYDAATLGVYLHAEAGQRTAKAMGTAGTTARDVLHQIALAGRALAGEEPISGPGMGGLAGLGGMASGADAGGSIPGGLDPIAQLGGAPPPDA